METLQIIVLHNGENVGDKNQSLGIATALEETCKHSIAISRREYSTKINSLEDIGKAIDAIPADSIVLIKV
jgi:hypothetical protein